MPDDEYFEIWRKKLHYDGVTIVLGDVDSTDDLTDWEDEIINQAKAAHPGCQVQIVMPSTPSQFVEQTWNAKYLYCFMHGNGMLQLWPDGSEVVDENTLRNLSETRGGFKMDRMAGIWLYSCESLDNKEMNKGWLRVGKKGAIYGSHGTCPFGTGLWGGKYLPPLDAL